MCPSTYAEGTWDTVVLATTLTEDPRIIIWYRLDSEIQGAPKNSSWIALTLSQSLELRGYPVWMDRNKLSPTSPKLRDSVTEAMKETDVAVICIGVGDLKRCLNLDDFLRWEIDTARRLEEEKKLEVFIAVHGTREPEDLICGNTINKDIREKTLKSLGEWGDDFLHFSQVHFVHFLDRDNLNDVVNKITARVK